MHQSIRAAFIAVLFLVFAGSVPVFADSDKSSRYFLASDITASGSTVNGVDVSNGKLNRSDTDLSSSTLNFSRVYSAVGIAAPTLGGWNHNYASQLLVNGLSYDAWRGAKSKQYKKKKTACTSGWNDIKGSLFNGQLRTAKARYHDGLCQISTSGKKIAKKLAEFAIHASSAKKGKKKHDKDDHGKNKTYTLVRPDGSSMSFVKHDKNWKTLSAAPFVLSRSGKNWKVATPNDSIETYNRNGLLVNTTNSSKQTTRLRYRAGKLDKITGPFGRTLQLTYQNGKLAKAVGALGTVSYTYAGDLLSNVTKVDGSSMGYQYQSGRLSKVVDALGQTIASYEYDSKGRVVNSAGQNNTRKTRYDYSGSGVQVTNIANNATDSYVFSVIRGVIKLASTTDVDGSKTTQSYDNNGYPYQSVAINGTKTRTVYNKRGLLVKRVESVGLASEKTTITKWHKNFRKPVLQVEDALKIGNKATQSTYNRKGLLVTRIEGVIKSLRKSGHDEDDDEHDDEDDDDDDDKKKHHKDKDDHHKLHIVLKDKRITRFRYNRKGQVIKTIAPNGAVTLTSYDKDGNRTGSANALGQENKTLSFDDTGKPLVSEDANGIQTNNNYDASGRLTSTTSNGRTTNYAYDASGRQTGVSNPDGSTTANEYDASGNIIKTIDQDGNASQSSFDSNGNQTSSQVKDDKGNVILSSASTYNNKNQLTKSTDAQGNQTTYEYDAQGNQTKVTDAKGNISQNQYDAQNRLVKTIDALGGETTYIYDADGNRTGVTAPNSANTAFAYDSFNQLTNEVSPDRGTTSYLYDGSGNQISISDANGNQKNISYDVLNRKTGESWTGAPDLTIAYTYDSCANGVGKLCAITDKSGSTSFAYDAKGQITQKTQTIDGIDLTKTYAYNNEGQLTSETYPSGAVIAYGYTVDKVTSISIDNAPYITDISYNGANQLTGWNWADGTSYTKTYDANGRLASFPLGNKTRTLAYDTNGNITGWSDTGTDEVKSFAYDALNRLTDYNKANTAGTLQTQGFSYDANGNRLELQDDSVQTVYSILANSNRLAQVGTTNYQYDANGNITDDGEHTYTYDSRNRLTGVDGTSSYLFNANNMRVKKTIPAGTVLYGWDNDRIFAEYDDAGAVIQETVYFASTPVALLKGGNTYRIFADQIDTPRVLTDNSNTVLWTWDSKPFGESTPDEDADKDGTSLSYNLRFPGQYYDVETDKHYNFNRDYNPVTGRYVQSDPIGLGGGLNGFGYVKQQPLLLLDADGARFRRAGNYSTFANLDISINSLTIQSCYNEMQTAFNILNRLKGYEQTSYDVETWYYRVVWKKQSCGNYDYTYDLSYDEPFSYGLALPYRGEYYNDYGFLEGSFKGALRFTW